MKIDPFRMPETLTVRDYFAAKAMQGHCAQANILLDALTPDECEMAFLNAAAFSYRCADAMLKEREK